MKNEPAGMWTIGGVATDCSASLNSAVRQFGTSAFVLWSRICGGLVRFARQLADDGRLLLAVRTAVLMKDLVKPNRGIAEDVGTLPRIPRQVGLRLAGDKSPVDGRAAVLLRDRQDRVEGAADRACHVLGADDRTPVRLQRDDPLLE